MNKFIRIALLGLATSIVSLNSGFAGSCGSCADEDKKDKKESSEGEKKEKILSQPKNPVPAAGPGFLFSWHLDQTPFPDSRDPHPHPATPLPAPPGTQEFGILPQLGSVPFQPFPVFRHLVCLEIVDP